MLTQHFVEHDVMILLSSNYNVDQVKKYEDKNKKPHYFKDILE